MRQARSHTGLLQEHLQELFLHGARCRVAHSSADLHVVRAGGAQEALRRSRRLLPARRHEGASKRQDGPVRFYGCSARHLLPLLYSAGEREARLFLLLADKSGDGLIQYLGPAAHAADELTIDRDIMVLAAPEIAELPGWMVGLVAAGGLAAALSTAAGLLLVISTSVAHDLVKKSWRPEITDRQELRMVSGLLFTAAYIV